MHDLGIVHRGEREAVQNVADKLAEMQKDRKRVQEMMQPGGSEKDGGARRAKSRTCSKRASVL